MLVSKSLYICVFILDLRMQNPEDLVLASVGNRFLAYAIDFILVFIVTYIVAYFAGLPLFDPESVAKLYENQEMLSEVSSTLMLIITPIRFLYRFLLESSSWQATLGKKIMKLRVVKTNGDSLRLKDSFIRNAAKELSDSFLMVFSFGLFNPQHQCLHDLVAKTYVVDAV